MKTTRTLLTVLLALLWCPACETADPDAGEPSVIRTALVDDARWSNVDALDVLVLDATQHPCSEVMAGPLADPTLRTDAVATSRSCALAVMDRVMGRVSEGKRTVLVVATHLANRCSDGAKEELDFPGSPMAAGCEELEVVAGKNHRVDVEMFPWRGSLRLGITLGCPSGVGAEVVLKALAARRHPPAAVLFGAPAAWKDAQKLTGLTLDAPTVPLAQLDDVDVPLCLVPSAPNRERFKPGKPDAQSDQACSRSLLDAIAAAHAGHIHAVATAPARKQSFQDLPGGPFPGHTELFHHHFGVSPQPVMLFQAPGMRLGLLTIHVALRDVAKTVTEGLLVDALQTLAKGLREDSGILSPRVDVLGLNPHASEGGRIGDEDVRVTSPAIARARSGGLLVEGPFPADGYFARYRERTPPDAVLALYHDQGLGPFKLWERGRGCQMTVGLSVPRSSADHGTAYDIAGQGIADARSMDAAIRLAAEVVRVRRHRTRKTSLTRSARAR